MKSLVAVAIGDKYVRQTEGMIDSYVTHNPDWCVRRYYNQDLDALLPSQCRNWTPFNRCELGRWYAMQKALKDCDRILYCDGDIRWYGKYEESTHGMCLFPHYVTKAARQEAKHWLYKDGVANIGMMEMGKSSENEGIFDFIIGEVLHNPDAFKHKDQLWLQNIVSCIPDCGYDCVYSDHGGCNVASWNLKHFDREVFEQDGRLWAGTRENKLYPLVSFHFSSKSLHRLDCFGDAVRKLKDAYIKEELA